MFNARLEEQKQQGLFRERVCVEQNHQGIMSTQSGHFLDFASNDYLGLRHHSDVLQGWVEGLELYGSGSGASPLVTGYMKAHQDLEQQVAKSLKREAALLFSSGFAANQALCRALFHGKDGASGNLFCDKLMHASFIDGALASSAWFKRFKHNDLNHLESLLQRKNNDLPTLVATESIFSMDGDMPDINAMAELSQKYDSWLMLDAAHSLGVLSIEDHPSQQNAPIIIGTFGKALGTGGAFIAGSETLISFLINFARDYIYSTAMPPAQAHATLVSWNIMLAEERTRELHRKIAYFKAKATTANIAIQPSDSAIQWIKIGSPTQTIALSQTLKQFGLWVGAMREPTVPKGTDRLRITLRADHSEKDIDALIDGICIANSQIEQTSQECEHGTDS